MKNKRFEIIKYYGVPDQIYDREKDTLLKIDGACELLNEFIEIIKEQEIAINELISDYQEQKKDWVELFQKNITLQKKINRDDVSIRTMISNMEKLQKENKLLKNKRFVYVNLLEAEMIYDEEKEKGYYFNGEKCTTDDVKNLIQVLNGLNEKLQQRDALLDKIEKRLDEPIEEWLVGVEYK